MKEAIHPTSAAGLRKSQAPQAQRDEGKLPLKAQLEAHSYTGFLIILNRNKSVNKENGERFRRVWMQTYIYTCS